MIENSFGTGSFKPQRTSVHLKKSLGQHFLRNRDAAAQIAGYLPRGCRAVEIGPGDGALTQELFERDIDITAIEVDAEMIPLLKRRFHRQKETFRIVVADALRINWATVAPGDGTYRLVGNLPYNIASQIIIRVLDAVRLSTVPIISEMIVMVQKEVAERITASPGSKIYGGLSVLAQFHAKCEYLFSIPSHDFFPKPQVDGGVIRLKFHEPGHFPEVEYQTFRRIVRGCFAQRRKILSNSIRVVNDLPDGWRDLPIDWNQRPERISMTEFVSLTNNLIRLGLPVNHSELANPDEDLN